MKYFFFFGGVLASMISFGQKDWGWKNVDSLYQPLPPSVHVYFTNKSLDTAVFHAYYLIADLNDKKLTFTTDTTMHRRLTPQQFYEKNSRPLAVVNGTFFSFETNGNLNLVIRDGKLVAYNENVALKGKDTLRYRHSLASAIGISKKRKADVAWVYADSSNGKVLYATHPGTWVDSSRSATKAGALKMEDSITSHNASLRKWKMQTAIGGGPVLLENGQPRITNNEEKKFGGKGISDKHPRTAMGYTADGHLIILVVEGRSESAHGATLVDEAAILKDLGCVEALNLDGGGSSCLLVNGKRTNRPSDKEGQRPVPGVFMIYSRY